MSLKYKGVSKIEEVVWGGIQRGEKYGVGVRVKKLILQANNKIWKLWFFFVRAHRTHKNNVFFFSNSLLHFKYKFEMVWNVEGLRGILLTDFGGELKSRCEMALLKIFTASKSHYLSLPFDGEINDVKTHIKQTPIIEK